MLSIFFSVKVMRVCLLVGPCLGLLTEALRETTFYWSICLDPLGLVSTILTNPTLHISSHQLKTFSSLFQFYVLAVVKDGLVALEYHLGIFNKLKS